MPLINQYYSIDIITIIIEFIIHFPYQLIANNHLTCLLLKAKLKKKLTYIHIHTEPTNRIDLNNCGFFFNMFVFSLFLCRFEDTDEYEQYESNIDLLETQIDDCSNEW